MNNKCSLFLAAASLFPALTFAEGRDSKDDDGFSAALGAGVFAQQSIYLGGDNQTEAFPYIELEYGPVFFQGGELGVFVGGIEEYGLGLALSVSGDFVGDNEYGKSKELADLPDLDTVINGSLTLMWETDYGEFNLSYATDVSSKHDGNTISLSYGKQFQFGKWMFGPEVEVSQSSAEVVQYYYGVDASQARAGRPIYSPDKSTNYSIGLMAGYQFDKHHSVMGMISAEFYGDEIKDSPIVEDDSAIEVGLFYVYRF